MWSKPLFDRFCDAVKLVKTQCFQGVWGFLTLGSGPTDTSTRNWRATNCATPRFLLIFWFCAFLWFGGKWGNDFQPYYYIKVRVVCQGIFCERSCIFVYLSMMWDQKSKKINWLVRIMLCEVNGWGEERSGTPKEWSSQSFRHQALRASEVAFSTLKQP